MSHEHRWREIHGPKHDKRRHVECETCKARGIVGRHWNVAIPVKPAHPFDLMPPRAKPLDPG